MIHSNIGYLEQAKSNNSHCWSCGKRIGKGVPRLWIWSKFGTNWKRNVCRECSQVFLDREILDIKRELTRFKRMKTKLKRMEIKFKDCIEDEKLLISIEEL